MTDECEYWILFGVGCVLGGWIGGVIAILLIIGAMELRD